MKKGNKMASVKFKLSVGIIELVAVICLVLGLVSYYLTYNAVSQQIDSKLSQKRDDVSKYISSYVESRKTEIKGIAALPDMVSMD